MCTMITKRVEVRGSGKAGATWFTVNQANVSYDHPYHVDLEHALNLDFRNEDLGLGARVAVELSAEDARQLATAILDTLAEAEQGGHIV